MLVKDILNNNNFKLINDVTSEIEVNNLFASDLLSHVMGFASENDVLLTVLNNINVLGVASLLDFSAVIFTHNIKVNENIIIKANELEIPIIQTSLSTAQAVIILNGVKSNN